MTSILPQLVDIYILIGGMPLSYYPNEDTLMPQSGRLVVNNTCIIEDTEHLLHAHGLKGQYRHDQSRLSTGHGIGVLV